MIARASDGALRDAESLLDQLSSFSDGEIREESVLTLLGLASDQVHETLIEAVQERDGQKILSIIQAFYEGSGDLLQLSRGFFEILRHLLVLQHVKKTEGLIEAGPQMLEMLQKHKNSFKESEILLGLAIFQNLQADLRRPVTAPRFMVETAFLKLIYADGMRSIGELLSSAQTAQIQPPAPVRNVPSAPPPNNVSFSQSPAPEITSATPAQPQPPTASASTAVLTPRQSSIALSQIGQVWPKVIEAVKLKRMSTGIFLSEAEPVEVDDSVIVLGLPEEFRFHKESLEKENNKKLVEDCFSENLGIKVRVRFVVTAQASSERKTIEPTPQAEPSSRELPDIITKALDVFDGAKIVRAE